jgi:pimeloyl-ACP methyl ester carboxylesterase
MHPEQIAGLVLIGTGTRFKLSGTYLELFEKGLDPEDPAVRQKLPEQFREAFAFLKDNSNPALHADLMVAGRFDSRDWISSISAQSLIVRGANDCVTPPDIPSELANMLPNAECVTIGDAGHVVMLEARDAFNARVSTFFESCP